MHVTLPVTYISAYNLASPVQRLELVKVRPYSQLAAYCCPSALKEMSYNSTVVSTGILVINWVILAFVN